MFLFRFSWTTINHLFFPSETILFSYRFLSRVLQRAILYFSGCKDAMLALNLCFLFTGRCTLSQLTNKCDVIVILISYVTVEHKHYLEFNVLYRMRMFHKKYTITTGCLHLLSVALPKLHDTYIYTCII